MRLGPISGLNARACGAKIPLNTTRMHGKAELSHYFVNNSKVDDGHLVARTVKGRSAVLVFDPHARWQSEIFQANRLCGGYA